MRSHAFSFTTCAPPEQVRCALTDGAVTRRYMYGLVAESGWQAGDAVTFATGTGPALRGEVLHATPRRLSFTLDAAYVTWELAQVEDGTLVVLCVDEPACGDAEEAEAAWRPVLAALQVHLDEVPQAGGDER
jgi:hypothetical protein